MKKLIMDAEKGEKITVEIGFSNKKVTVIDNDNSKNRIVVDNGNGKPTAYIYQKNEQCFTD